MTYGKTFELDADMDVKLNNLRRIPLIEDTDKVQQDFQVLFRTHLGDDLFNPNFGIDFAVIAEIDTEEVKKREIRAAAMKYKYTKKVVSVAIAQTQNTSTGVWSETWTVVLELLTGDEIAVEVTI